MILAFKPQFVDPILNGTKTLTIRDDKTRRWKPGMKAHMATGVRTKNYNQFAEARCKCTKELTIIRRLGSIMAIIDARILEFEEVVNLVRIDGFKNVQEFADWHAPQEGSVVYKRIIEWTDLKPVNKTKTNNKTG